MQKIYKIKIAGQEIEVCQDDDGKFIKPDIVRELESFGTALKPAWEPILVFRKPVIGTVAENVLKYGTGAMNIDECRVGEDTISVHNAPSGTFAGGNYDRGSDTKSYREHKGRWPANLMHDGSEEVEELFPEQKSGAMLEHYEYTNTGFALGKPTGKTKQIHPSDSGKASRFFKRFPANLVHDGSEEVEELFPETGKATLRNPTGKKILDPKDGWNENSMVDKTVRGIEDEGGSASRFFYCAKADKGERDLGLEQEEGEFMDEGREEGSPGGTNPRNRGAQTARKNFHPTVKPVALMKWLINLVSRKDSLILDPFVGSGSTLVACKKLGRKVVGIEKDEEYCKITQKRLKAPLQKTFF